MSSYWDNVPKGVWTVVDPDDALLALRDDESRAVLVMSHSGERINVYGPAGKALILNLEKMQELLGDEFESYRNHFLKFC